MEISFAPVVNVLPHSALGGACTKLPAQNRSVGFIVGM